MNGVPLYIKVMKMSKTIRYKKISVDQAKSIINSTNYSRQHRIVKYATATRRPKTINATVTEIKITRSYNINQKIRNAHGVAVGVRKRVIHKLNSARILGKKTVSSIDENAESINEGVSSEVSNLNRQAIRAGKNLQLKHNQIKRNKALKKRKEENNDKLNIKVKYKNTNQDISGIKTGKGNSNTQKSFSSSKYKLKNRKQIKQTRNPAVKQKISKAASKLFNKSAKIKNGTKMVKSVTFSFKAIKGLIIALGSSGAALLAFVVIIGAVLMMVASPFSILLDDNPVTMRKKINDYYTEYRTTIDEMIKLNTMNYPVPDGYNKDNDRVRIIGSSPDIKEVLKLYIARNDEDPDGDVLIDTEEFDINKFKKAFSDLNSIDKKPTVTEYTHQEERKKKNGKTETITVLDYREIIFYQSSETALHYATRTKMTDSQIETIKELSDPEFDKAWENLLYGIQTFSYIVPGTMPYYNQGDYSNVSYGPGSLASDGCGPTAFAMVVSYLKGRQITPPEILKWCGNDYYAWPDSGTMWSFFPDAAQHYGIQCESDVSFDRAVSALKEGKVVISIQRVGIFTGGGHFIVLRGITPDGKILVSDPNGYNANKWGLTIDEYNKKQWEPEQISASNVNCWVFSSDMQMGGNPAEEVWLTLRARGYSEIVTAGILGNMMTECGGNTLDLQWNVHGHYYGSTFYGLCQWCMDYRPASFDGCSIQEQLNYLSSSLESEMNTFGSNYQSGYNYNSFIKAKSVDETAAAFAACYERPGYEYNNYEQRRKNAWTAYNYFHGKKY